jgi:uncharacterized protein (DUF58 family)
MQTSELLHKVHRLEIRSRHLVEDLFAGRSTSVFKGRGVEFEEVRPYVPGDEVRDIDWNVTARLGEPYVKRFVEERELTVMLVVDVSASMRFGTTGSEKRELAAELVAVLGFAAVSNNDRVGLVLASDRVEHFVPAGPRTHPSAAHGARRARRAARRPWYAARGSGALPRAHGPAAQSGVLDLRLRGNAGRARVAQPRQPSRADRARAARSALTSGLPNAGWVEFEDLESGARRLVNTSSRRVRDAYERDAAERRARRTAALREARVPALEIPMERSYLPVLIEYFSSRGSRVRH